MRICLGGSHLVGGHRILRKRYCPTRKTAVHFGAARWKRNDARHSGSSSRIAPSARSGRTIDRIRRGSARELEMQERVLDTRIDAQDSEAGTVATLPWQPTDSIRQKLEAARKDLLDLGLRNSLLNYRLL